MRQLAFAVACGLAVGLLLLAAPWHVKSRNSGTILYIGWALVGNLIFLVNAIVWNGNISNPAPIWCDIATKLIIGLNVAMPCVSLCIQRRLHHISTISRVSPTQEQRRREIYIDLSIGLGIPVLVMILHYIVQGHRYDIYEDYGCWPNIYLSWPAFVLVLPWPTIISSVSLIYAGFTVRNFLQRRATFNELLKAQSTGLNVNRYFRLMALASIEMLFVFPMSVVALVHNSNLGINPWISWENTHYNFGRISYITTFLFKSSGNNTIVFELTRWCMPLAGFLFFIFFGLASECRKQYRKSFDAFTQTVGIRPAGLQYLDRKDTPLTATTLRSPGFARRGSNATSAMKSPTETKGRPDTFAWMDEEGAFPFDDPHFSLPQAPSLSYDARPRRSHMPTPSTSYDSSSSIGRQDSISSSRSGKTMRDSQDDDDATICGVPTSLKRADSIDKPLPEIPFQNFANFRQSQIAARQSAADPDLEAQDQVQIFVSSPTNTEFDHSQDERTDVDHSTPVMPTRSLHATPVLPTRSLSPPEDPRPLSTTGSMLSEDGGETVFFTPAPGRLSLLPFEFDVTPGTADAPEVTESRRTPPLPSNSPAL